MCTENERFQNSINIEKKLNLEEAKVCLKCKINIPVAFLRSDGVYCRECFVARITHKFRLEFGKSHLIRDNEKALVFIEYDKYSLVMLHLINEGISRRAKKKLRFVPICVVVIEENGQGLIDEIKKKFINLIEIFELPICIYHMNQLHDDEFEPIYSNANFLSKQINFENNDADRLSIRFKNETSKITFNTILRRQLLVRVSRQLGISKVITCENANQLASSLILNVIEGRGDQLSHFMSFVDARHDDVLFVRPLKNFTDAEVDACIHLHSMQLPQSLLPHQIKDEYLQYTSMQNLAETFLTNLQKDNENTLSIVCRIGEKFSQLENAPNKCLLCQTPCFLDQCTRADLKVDKNEDSTKNQTQLIANDCTKLNITLKTCISDVSGYNAGCNATDSVNNASHIPTTVSSSNYCSNETNGVSDAAYITNSSSNDCRNSTDATDAACNVAAPTSSSDGTSEEGTDVNMQTCCLSKTKAKTICCREQQFEYRNKEELLKYSCYGCQILLNDMKDINQLPNFVFNDLIRLKNRIAMRETVKDFLFEDD